MNVDTYLSSVSGFLQGSFGAVKDQISYAGAVDIELLQTLKLIALMVAVSLGAALLIRFLFGSRSSMNGAISSSIGILAIYALTVVIYTLNPWRLADFISPLPFAIFRKDILIILPFYDTPFQTLCREILNLVILSFVVNFLDTVIPRGQSAISWYLLRGISVVAAMFLNLTITWAVSNYMSAFFTEYAPLILLAVLISFLLLGISKVAIGLFLTAINPFIGAVYTFFFSNLIGKQLSKAVMSAGLICALFRLMEYFGYSVLFITKDALISYIPLTGSLFILWYLIGHEL